MSPHGSADGHFGATTALVALGGEDLVVVVAEPKARRLPGLKMGPDVDGATRSLLLADGPELGETEGFRVSRLPESDIWEVPFWVSVEPSRSYTSEDERGWGRGHGRQKGHRSMIPKATYVEVPSIDGWLTRCVW